MRLGDDSSGRPQIIVRKVQEAVATNKNVGIFMTLYAYAARAWAWVQDAPLTPMDNDMVRRKAWGPEMTAVLWAPYTLAADLWETVWSRYTNMFLGGINR